MCDYTEFYNKFTKTFPNCTTEDIAKAWCNNKTLPCIISTRMEKRYIGRDPITITELINYFKDIISNRKDKEEVIVSFVSGYGLYGQKQDIDSRKFIRITQVIWSKNEIVIYNIAIQKTKDKFSTISEFRAKYEVTPGVFSQYSPIILTLTYPSDPYVYLDYETSTKILKKRQNIENIPLYVIDIFIQAGFMDITYNNLYKEGRRERVHLVQHYLGYKDVD